LLVAGAAAVLACAHTGSPGTRETINPQAPDTTVRGVVYVVGADPFTHVVVRGPGGDVAVTGLLAGELRALSGAEVRIAGWPAAPSMPPPRRAVDVTGYEVLSINGATPAVGVLFERNGALWLAGRDTVPLVNVPPDFAGRPGDKMFVVGPMLDGKLSVSTYGVIRRGEGGASLR
ncbi:MAG: hypothetical protein ACREN3_00820, partial [Gemmatimonadaceae bacterium]